MPRRSPSQQAADLRAKAAALDFKARVAESPALKMAIKLKAELQAEPSTTEVGILCEALDAYIGVVPE